MADPAASPSPPPVPRYSPNEPTAIWSLVLGILSFFCGAIFTAIPAVICGHIARSRIRRSGGALGGKAMATIGLVFGYIMVALTLMGLPLLVSLIRHEVARQQQLSTETREFTSNDGKIRVTIPAPWVEIPQLNEKATIRVGNKWREQYLIVIGESKASVQNIAMEKYHQKTGQNMLGSMQNASATTPVPLTINGHAALQDELSGSKSGTNIIFIHTTVDAGPDYYQVLAWTLKSRWEANKELLRTATATVRDAK